MELTKGGTPDESLDLTLTSEQVRAKKNLKPFSIESLISSKSDEKSLIKNGIEVKKLSWTKSEVFNCENETSGSVLPKRVGNPDNRRRHLEKALGGTFLADPSAREKYFPDKIFSERVPENDLKEIFPNGLNSFPGNGIGEGNFGRLHGSAGFPVNFLNKVHGGNSSFPDNGSYNWPFIYNTWLHNAGLLLNASVNGAIMGPQEFRSASHGQIASPISPVGENSDASLSPGGIHDGSRNSGEII